MPSIAIPQETEHSNNLCKQAVSTILLAWPTFNCGQWGCRQM